MELKKPGDKYLEKQKTAKSASPEKVDNSPPAKTKKAPKSTSAKSALTRSTLTKTTPLTDTATPPTTSHLMRNIITIAIPLAVVALGVFLFFALSADQTNQKQLESDLEKIGRDFYEDYYYEQISIAYDSDEKLTEFLSKYSSTGINVNLANLERYPSNNLNNKDLVATFKNNQTDEPCNTEKTKVIIKPEEPYDKTSYQIETILVCGFDDPDTN